MIVYMSNVYITSITITNYMMVPAKKKKKNVFKC